MEFLSSFDTSMEFADNLWGFEGKMVERWKEKVGLVVAQAMDVFNSSLCFVCHFQSSFVSEKKRRERKCREQSISAPKPNICIDFWTKTQHLHRKVEPDEAWRKELRKVSTDFVRELITDRVMELILATDFLHVDLFAGNAEPDRGGSNKKKQERRAHE
ncbi:hypothetical protein EV1_039158 [Malus domestica]